MSTNRTSQHKSRNEAYETWLIQANTLTTYNFTLEYNLENKI